MGERKVQEKDAVSKSKLPISTKTLYLTHQMLMIIHSMWVKIKVSGFEGVIVVGPFMECLMFRNTRSWC